MIRPFYGKFRKGTDFLQSIILLTIRLLFGIQTAQSGYTHLHHLSATVDAFKGWGVPFPTVSVYVSGWTELVLGSMLILGLGTRLISLPLAYNFLMAIIALSHHELWDELSSHQFTDAYHTLLQDAAFPFLIATLITMAFGGGTFALDTFFRQSRAPAPKSGK